MAPFFQRRVVSPVSQRQHRKKESNATTPYAYGNFRAYKLNKDQWSKVTRSYPIYLQRYVFERVMTSLTALEYASAAHRSYLTLQGQVNLKIHNLYARSSGFIRSTAKQIKPFCLGATDKDWKILMMMMIVSLQEDKTSPKLPVRKDSALGLKRRKSRTVRGKRLSRVNHHQRCPSCLYPGCHLLGHRGVHRVCC